MNTAITSVNLTSMQVLVLELAFDEIEIRVTGRRVTAARALEGKGLGHVTDLPGGVSFFKINTAGCDQLRIRA